MLAERWNGSSWKIQPTPNPPGAISSTLSGVSCTAAAACTAVGEYGNSSFTGGMLAERWNGSSWAAQPTPSNPAGNIFFVSCTAATACTAVGDYTNSSGTQLTLAERWNGSRWKIQPTPNPAGATFSGLFGVSCTAATACTAVGDGDYSSSTQVTLAERYS
jgi:hypothetical protein